MPRYEGTEIHCCPLVGELNVAMEAGSTTTSWFAVRRRAEDGTVIWSADQAKRTVTQCTTWRSPGSSSEPTIILQRIQKHQHGTQDEVDDGYAVEKVLVLSSKPNRDICTRGRGHHDHLRPRTLSAGTGLGDTPHTTHPSIKRSIACTVSSASCLWYTYQHRPIWFHYLGRCHDRFMRAERVAVQSQ